MKSKDKSLAIKKKICEALEGRKEKEEGIISLFFGNGEMRKEGMKKHRGMYKMVKKNISKMDDKKLNDIYDLMMNTGSLITK